MQSAVAGFVGFGQVWVVYGGFSVPARIGGRSQPVAIVTQLVTTSDTEDSG